MTTQCYEQLAHTQWDCTYHIVIVPKYRKKVLFQGIRQDIADILKKLAKQYDVEIIKGNVGGDHIHIIMRIAPKYSVAQTVGRLKGKSAIILHNTHAKKKQISQKSFWSRGYFVSTVGIDLEVIKKYVEDQWKQDQKFDSNQLDFSW